MPDPVKQIALTFDDGPGPYTAELLWTLAEYDVAATFFVVGSNVHTRPELVRETASKGHEIGNHSYDHPDLTSLDPETLRREIDRTTEAIRMATGDHPTLARPPYGATNDAVASLLSDRGYTQVLWDVDSEDWDHHDTSLTTDRVLAGARDGAVVLLHDTLPTTVEAVPAIIEGLVAEGFTFVTVSQLRAGGRRAGATGPES